MKEYRVTREIETAEEARLSVVGWETTYDPETTARLAFAPEDGFTLRMRCRERDPRRTYTQFFDPVYKDSCMEFFVSFGTGVYMNIEMNANGAVLCAVGAGREDRTPLSEIVPLVSPASPFEISATVREDAWEVEAKIPTSLVEAVFGIDRAVLTAGYRFRGNFMKCGDETASPHYLLWAPVDTPEPDFHRPEFFGEFVL